MSDDHDSPDFACGSGFPAEPGFRYGARERSLARQAYRALEPLHLIAYFSPAVRTTGKATGMRFVPRYVGLRAAPLGPAASSVVVAAFYSWSPVLVDEGWTTALEKFSVEELIDLRNTIAETTLTELFDAAELASAGRIAARLQEIAGSAEVAGRALGAANLSLPVSDHPAVALWQATSFFREWRGDGHVSALVVNGLGPVEAVVFHEARHPDPAVKVARTGREALQAARRISDDDWVQAARSLAARGLLTIADQEEALTAEGAALFQRIEDQTDDAAAGVWVDVPDAEELFAQVRPLVKKVIDQGFLPGTVRK